jgi:hypothetical protein
MIELKNVRKVTKALVEEEKNKKTIQMIFSGSAVDLLNDCLTIVSLPTKAFQSWLLENRDNIYIVKTLSDCFDSFESEEDLGVLHAVKLVFREYVKKSLHVLIVDEMLEIAEYIRKGGSMLDDMSPRQRRVSHIMSVWDSPSTGIISNMN